MIYVLDHQIAFADYDHRKSHANASAIHRVERRSQLLVSSRIVHLFSYWVCFVCSLHFVDVASILVFTAILRLATMSPRR